MVADMQTILVSTVAGLFATGVVGWISWLHNKVGKMEEILGRVVSIEKVLVDEQRRVGLLEDIGSKNAARLAVLDRNADEFTPVLRELSTTVAKLSAVVDILRKDYLDNKH